MTAILRLAWFVVVAASGTLLGHAVSYVVEHRALTDGRHAYFVPALDAVLALLIGGAVLYVACVMLGRGRELPLAWPAQALWRVWYKLGALQVGGFILLEAFEHNRADYVGCVVQALVALLLATALTLLFGLVERCAEALGARYLARCAGAACVPVPRSAVTRARLLTECAGVRRFKRPPPMAA
ncbi:hypothetical protein EPN52_10785 [bacterium]|nr:MAG: hypothetical protein EPN52_10785 [bacterium]